MKMSLSWLTFSVLIGLSSLSAVSHQERFIEQATLHVAPFLNVLEDANNVYVMAQLLRTEYEEIQGQGDSLDASLSSQLDALLQGYKDTFSQVREAIQKKEKRFNPHDTLASQLESFKECQGQAKKNINDFLSHYLSFSLKIKDLYEKKHTNQKSLTQRPCNEEKRLLECYKEYYMKIVGVLEELALFSSHLNYLEDTATTRKEVTSFLENAYSFLKEVRDTPPHTAHLLKSMECKVNKEYTLRKRQNLTKNIVLGFMAIVLAESLREKSWIRRKANALLYKVRRMGSSILQYFSRKKQSQASA